MKPKLSESLTIIKSADENINLFLENVATQYNSYKGKNIIFDISINKELTHNDILLLDKLATKHKKEKKSFVVVANQSFDFNQATDKVIFVPTLQEAYDIIEMEDIERDLGF